MATPAMSPAGASAPKGSRGKDQIQWSDEVWKALDQAITDEITRTRQVAKFLPMVYVEKKRTTVEADIVVPPLTAKQAADKNVPFDPALSVDETQTNRIQEYFTTFRLSVAQVEAEEHQETQANNQTAASALPSSQGSTTNGQATANRSHRAGTAMSLALRCANVLAQAEDLILLNGQNAVVNAPLFTSQQVQSLAGNSLQTDLDLGLLNIQSLAAGSQGIPSGQAANVITLPPTQVIAIHPVPATVGGQPSFPFLYRENTLNAVAQGFSALQGQGHYENYALILHTYPYADLHQALPNTLIEPVEPISHLVTAGIYGTGALPPFTAVTTDPLTPAQSASAGLPTLIATSQSPLKTQVLSDATSIIAQPPIASGANVLYTGILLSLSGNTMDQVRCILEDSLDAMVTFNQKDQNEQYRFRVFERFALRLKDPTAVILLLFLDS